MSCLINVVLTLKLLLCFSTWCLFRDLFSLFQTDIQLNQWVEEMQLNYDVYTEKDVDREALEQIHLYRIL